jgi:hypothetical protein
MHVQLILLNDAFGLWPERSFANENHHRKELEKPSRKHPSTQGVPRH